MQPPPRPQTGLQPGHTDMFLQMLEGPVVAVVVGTGPLAPRYNLPAALLSSHSHFFKYAILRHESGRAGVNGNKKRKASSQDEPTTVKVEKVDGETEAVMVEQREQQEEEIVIRLPDVDSAIFGLFLKYVYMGFYPATVDARPGSSHTSTSKQHDQPYTPAKAAMPPPATTNSRSVLPGSRPHLLPTQGLDSPQLSTKTGTQDGNNHAFVPPSVHAYLVSIRLSAPGFLNQALNHIYYGIGKYFALTPSLVEYICSHTAPGSTLRKLILDVLVVHWPSSTTHIIAKHAALNKHWNKVFDAHQDLRHEFTVGLQGSMVVLPVQAYFVSTAVSTGATRKEVEECKRKVGEVRPTQVNTSAAEAAARAAAAEQDKEKRGEGKE